MTNLRNLNYLIFWVFVLCVCDDPVNMKWIWGMLLYKVDSFICFYEHSNNNCTQHVKKVEIGLLVGLVGRACDP